jgi:Predicted hydrolases or acyltransferases (alpha/beta hydrolase superfamily)
MERNVMSMTFSISIVILLAAVILLPIIRQSEYSAITHAVRGNAAGEFLCLSQGYTHYEIAGPEHGPVVVFIHGFSVPYYMWDRNFTELSHAGYRVVRYDIYGRGLSDRPKVVYDRQLFVTQLIELLASLTINEPIHLVGNSMGGAVAAAFAADFPERVGKLILIDPFYEKWSIGPFKIPILGEYLCSSILVPGAPRRQLQDFFHPERFPDWPKLFRVQMRYKGFAQALLSTLRNFINRDPTPDYHKIARENKPILLIWGTEDRTLNTKGAIKLYHILHPKLLWVEHAGHVPHYELPEIVNPRIINFLTDRPEEELIKNRA